MSSLGSSLQLSLIATAVALAIGLPFAFLASRKRVPGKRIWQWALLLPLCLPVHGYGGLVLHRLLGAQARSAGYFPALDETSILTAPLVTAAVELAMVYFPLVALPTLWSLLNLNRRIEESARIYRSSTAVFFRIKLPLVFPLALTGTVLVFVFCLFDYAIAHGCGLQTLATEWMVRGGNHQVNPAQILGLIPFAVCSLAIALGLMKRTDRMNAGSVFANGNSSDRRCGRRRVCIPGLTAGILLLAAAALAPVGLAGFGPAAAVEPPGNAMAVLSTVILAALIALAAAGLLLASADAQLEDARRGPLRAGGQRGFILLCGVFICTTAVSLALHLPVTAAIFTGCFIAVICATAHFLAVCLGGANDDGFFIHPAIHDAARLYQPSGWQRYRKIALPLFGKRMIACALAAFLLSRPVIAELIAGTAALPAAGGPTPVGAFYPVPAVSDAASMLTALSLNLAALALAYGINRWGLIASLVSNLDL